MASFKKRGVKAVISVLFSKSCRLWGDNVISSLDKLCYFEPQAAQFPSREIQALIKAHWSEALTKTLVIFLAD